VVPPAFTEVGAAAAVFEGPKRNEVKMLPLVRRVEMNEVPR
jgi:hypothetical protein